MNDEACSFYRRLAEGHLRHALLFLDRAGEMSAAPYAQMALDMLSGSASEALIVPDEE